MDRRCVKEMIRGKNHKFEHKKGFIANILHTVGRKSKRSDGTIVRDTFDAKIHISKTKNTYHTITVPASAERIV